MSARMMSFNCERSISTPVNSPEQCVTAAPRLQSKFPFAGRGVQHQRAAVNGSARNVTCPPKCGDGERNPQQAEIAVLHNWRQIGCTPARTRRGGNGLDIVSFI